MRISGGLFRGRILKTPKGDKTRPTTEMARAAIFNVCRGWLEGARFLDLYAGTGAMGFEAISQGASFATFVESDRSAAQCIRENAKTLQIEPQVQILAMSVQRALDCLMSPYDLIYVDPPYEKDVKLALHAIVEKGLLAPHGLLFVEERFEAKKTLEIEGLELIESRRYGLAQIHQLRHPSC